MQKLSLASRQMIASHILMNTCVLYNDSFKNLYLYLYLTMMALVWNVGIISSDRTPCAVFRQIAELMSHNQAIRR